ncbi:threonylcarbamoyl-AMP synthase [Anoxybacter fermentans]|uniref:Threonylcarbamoyl-AMP synthase n=1 Tax=Anoxybacter fermentans TaxID=1323375 RepID=A0A3Q9HS06_9FIRM|nr:L-threonylcarbamoyladenylate synthase [Anoxybacter fermentans]AZR74011.1 threonylcarbamoyl-AMP synthase [Anoxybacter fermentans]
MKTIVLKLDPEDKDLSSHPGIIKGGKILREGGLVAFPTETVYGLGANGLDPKAVKKIYQAKGRPSDNPLILHIADLSDLEELVTVVPKKAKVLIEKFWPGPLTLVLKKKNHVPDEVTGGLNTVAVRMPSHPIARELIAAANVPVAAPSANLSGRPSPTLAEHVIHDLNGRVEMIIDGGSCHTGIESTVLDFSEDKPILLRPGSISLEAIEDLIGPLKLDAGIATKEVQHKKPKSPGMKYRHYSPEAELLIVEGESERVKEKLIELIKNSQKKLGLLATRELVESLDTDLPPITVKVLGSREKLEEIGINLFKLLREFDETEVDLILVEGLPLHGLGLAVMNRLRKAAGYQIIRV